MQATITYLLTESAQRAQMAATGQPVARKQMTTVEVSAEDLPLMQVAEDGTAYLDLAGYWPGVWRDALKAVDAVEDMSGTQPGKTPTCNLFVGFVAPNPDVLALIRAGREKIRAAKQAAEAERQQKINESIAKFLGGEDGNWHLSTDGKSIYNPWDADVPLDHPQAPAILERIRQMNAAKAAADLQRGEDLYRRMMADPGARKAKYGGSVVFTGSATLSLPESHPRTAEWLAELKGREEADKIAAGAKEQAKIDYIADWIAGHADADTREQYDEGLLARSAALTLIANDLFSSHDIGEPIEVPDTCDDTDCPCCDSSVETLPRRIYPVWRELKAKLPKGSKATFSKVRECLRSEEGCWDSEDGESAGPAYYTATLTVPCGPFQFERRVKLG